MKNKLQDSRGCSRQVVFHYFFGQQTSEVREQWLHPLLEEWEIESAVLSSGETSQRVYFGRSVWSDSVTMSSRLLPGASHQLEPACQGDAHSLSPTVPPQDMCREDPRRPTQNTAPSSPRRDTEAQARKQLTQDSKQTGGWESPGKLWVFWFYLVDSLAGFRSESQRILFLFFWSVAVHIYLDNVICHKSHTNLTNSS